MKLTIIKNDGAVYIDGLSYSGLTLNTIPDNIHAFQWNSDKGWIEFCSNNDGTKPKNEPVTELPVWVEDCIQAWNIANEEKIKRISIENELNGVNNGINN